MQRYLIAIDPRKIEQVVDEPDHVTQLPIDHCEMLLFERCQGRVAQQSQHVSSRCQRRAQFMGKQRNELIFALLLFHQRLLGTVSVGHIECDAQDAADLAKRIAFRKQLIVVATLHAPEGQGLFKAHRLSGCDHLTLDRHEALGLVGIIQHFTIGQAQ